MLPSEDRTCTRMHATRTGARHRKKGQENRELVNCDELRGKVGESDNEYCEYGS